MRIIHSPSRVLVNIQILRAGNSERKNIDLNTTCEPDSSWEA